MSHKMKTTIVIPILYFNEYSAKSIKYISTLPAFNNLQFLFVVHSQVESELKSIINGMSNHYEIIVTHKHSSNELRHLAKYATTKYVYYHDCDDVADYEFINEFCDTLEDDRYVHVFNVTKVIIDDSGNETERHLIYNTPEGEITDAQYLQQNVYSKFIPTKFIDLIDFPNLPFTQDWAVSYSLYLLAPHVSHSRSTYTYYFYPGSSSKPIHDTVYRLMRVEAYSRTIIRKFKQHKKFNEANFLKMIYDILLSNRYYGVGIKYRLAVPGLRTFIYLRSRRKISFIYQFARFVYRSLKCQS